MQTSRLDWTKENALLQEALITRATAVVKKMTAGGFTEVADRKAVYFSVRKDHSAERFFRVKIGSTFPDDGFQQGCFECSAEKEERVNFLELNSSYQKRDEQKKKYGGAVKLTINGVTWIFSMSGFREPEDQSGGLLTAHLLAPDQINLEAPQVKKIIKISSPFENRTAGLFRDVSLQLTGT